MTKTKTKSAARGVRVVEQRVYTVAHLKRYYPEGFERALERYRENVAQDTYRQDEIIDSLKVNTAPRCGLCVGLVCADPSLLFTHEKGPKAWQLGPDAYYHWAQAEGWDRAACGSRVLRIPAQPSKQK